MTPRSNVCCRRCGKICYRVELIRCWLVKSNFPEDGPILCDNCFDLIAREDGPKVTLDGGRILVE